MARKVIGQAAGVKIKYIPEAYGNRDDKTPVVFYITNPTLRERRGLFSSALAGTKPIGDSAEFEIDLQSSFGIYEEAIKKFVVSVENYSYASGEITDGDLLIEHGELDFILEVANQILGEGDEKKSEELSGYTQQKTSPSTGIAASALPQAKTKTGTAAATATAVSFT